MLIEQDGSEWREKLPDIPLVPLSAQQHRREEPPSAEVLQARAEKAARDAGGFPRGGLLVLLLCRAMTAASSRSTPSSQLKAAAPTHSEETVTTEAD